LDKATISYSGFPIALAIMNRKGTLGSILQASLIILSVVLCSGMGLPKSKTRISEQGKNDLALAEKLANNPGLLRPNYLSYLVGTDEFSTNSIDQNPCYWYEGLNHTLHYELKNTGNGSGYCSSKFSIYLPNEAGISKKDVQSLFSVEGKQAFDQEGRKIEQFQISPNTAVNIFQDPNFLTVRQISVEYAGAALPPPSAEHMKAALDTRRQQAFAHHEKGRHDVALPLLKAHLNSNPADVEARIRLAESYKAKACLNEAIAEYKLALSKCGDNTSLRNQCLDGLRALKVNLEPAYSTQWPAKTSTWQTRKDQINQNDGPVDGFNNLNFPVPNTWQNPANWKGEELGVGF